jgi:hypothetical protein
MELFWTQPWTQLHFTQEKFILKCPLCLYIKGLRRDSSVGRATHS